MVSLPGVAWSKIRAVYGPFQEGITIEQLKRKRDVTSLLGKSRNIFKMNVGRFFDQMGPLGVSFLCIGGRSTFGIVIDYDD